MDPYFNWLDIVCKWAVVVGFFQVLLYLFQDRVVLEGLPGNIWLLVIIAPTNLMLSHFLEGQYTLSGNHLLLALLLTSVILNTVILFAINRFLPGLVTDSLMDLGFFCAAFSLVVYLLRIVPEVPPINTWATP